MFDVIRFVPSILWVLVLLVVGIVALTKTGQHGLPAWLFAAAVGLMVFSEVLVSFAPRLVMNWIDSDSLRSLFLVINSLGTLLEIGAVLLMFFAVFHGRQGKSRLAALPPGTRG